MDSMEEVRFRSLSLICSVLCVLWCDRSWNGGDLGSHPQTASTHRHTLRPTKKGTGKKKKEKKHTTLALAYPWYMYCVVSVYDKRVKNYYQNMIWIMFAPLTILLLNFFLYHYILFIYFVSFGWSNFLFCSWMVVHVCDMHPYIRFIIFARRCHLTQMGICLHFQWNALWHAHTFARPHSISVDIVAWTSSERTNVPHYYLFDILYFISFSLRFVAFHYRSYFNHLCPVFWVG